MPTITKHITILPGECFTLPKGAIVTAVSDTLTNSCDFDLPTPTALKCYRFKWETTNNTNGNTDAWDETNVNNKIVGYVFDNVNYTTDLNIGDVSGLTQSLILNLTSKGITNLSNFKNYINGDNVLGECFITFKAFSSVVSSFYIKVQLSSGVSDIRIYPTEITCP